MTLDRARLVDHARATIARGSRSFAAASRLFDPVTRERTWLLYAWCRACDDMADAQELGGALGDQSGATERLETIRRLTAMAFAGKPGGEPSFDCLAVVARECGITPGMVDDVIAGFALDAEGWHPPSEADMLRYCFHVAGAVGVMMALVMGVDPQDEETLSRACDLGMAFQLANIMRDLDEDNAAGRCYLPDDWLAETDIPPGEQMKPQFRPALLVLVRRMADMAAAYEASARIGARSLPFRSRWAVLCAAGIYGAIARKTLRGGAHAWDRRVTVSRPAKLGHVVLALIRALVPWGTTTSRPLPTLGHFRRSGGDHARQPSGDDRFGFGDNP